jgi:hypothetical protein
LRHDDVRLLAAIERWEREDRTHLDGYTQYFNGRGIGEFAHEIEVAPEYAIRALPDIRHCLHIGQVLKSDSVVYQYFVTGLKPVGVQTLKAWGVPVQDWRN